MWVKNLDEIAKLIPRDDKYHNIQIMNNTVYIDGQEVMTTNAISKVRIFDRALTKDEIIQLFNMEES